MRSNAIRTALTALLLAGVCEAQVTVRDTIVALPPISFCQDGATHVTVCTNHRLRPASGMDLSRYVGMPLEITGTPRMITCAFLDVQSVTVLGVHQFTTTSSSGSMLTASFFGAGANTDVFLLYLGAQVLTSGLPLPPIAGVLHLDPSMWIFAGVFNPLGSGTPYASFSIPDLPIFRGVDLYDQAIVVHASLAAEMSNVDCFSF